MEKIIELCENCNEEIEITKKGGYCSNCGAFVKPCSLCDNNKINCNDCIFDKNKKDIVKYKNILKEFEKNNIFLTKLEILDHLQGFDSFNDLNEEVQEKTLDFLYSYWLEADLKEHTLFDYVEAFCNSNFYGFGDILGEMEHLTYKEFIDIIEERSIL